MSRPRKPSPGALSPGWMTAALVAVLAVLLLTLRPDRSPAPAGGVNLEPLSHQGRVLGLLVSGEGNRPVITRYLLTEVLGNVLLFVPVGIALGGAVRRSGTLSRIGLATGFGIVLSVAVEGIQLAVPGRASDVDDVLFNTFGALLGGRVAAAWAARARRR